MPGPSACVAAFLLASTVALTGCGDDKQTPAQTPSSSTKQVPSPAADLMSPSLKCLVEGSPWHADVDQLMRETADRLSNGMLKDLSHSGTSTLTVDADLHVRYVQDTLTKAHMDLPAGQSFDTEVTTKGTVTGSWTDEDGKLVPGDGWTSTLKSVQSMSGGGQTTTADMTDMIGLSKKPVTYTCAKDNLKLTMQGSKFTIPFT